MHIAGNDANFTLKALLTIAVRSVEGLSLNVDQRSTITKLQAIAHFSIGDKLLKSTPDMLQRTAQLEEKVRFMKEAGLAKRRIRLEKRVKADNQIDLREEALSEVSQAEGTYLYLERQNVS